MVNRYYQLSPPQSAMILTIFGTSFEKNIERPLRNALQALANWARCHKDPIYTVLHIFRQVLFGAGN